MKIDQPRIKELSPDTFESCIENEDFYNKLILDSPSVVLYEPIKVDSCKFVKVDFTKSKIIFRECLDVIFENCDLSNYTFQDCIFQRCIFKNCKILGSNFYECIFKHVVMESCLLRLTNISKTKLDFVSIRDSNCDETRFFECILKNIELKTNEFRRAEFFETPLTGVSFASSNIEGISIDIVSLKGIKVNSYQALTLAGLLGIEVVED